MEEVVFAELDDLVVHEVQQFGVALLHGGRDGVVVTKVGDADLEALVGLGPGEHLGVVGGEGVTTAVQQRVVGIGVLVVLLQLDVRRVLLEPGFGGGALSDDQGLAVELADIGDLGALRGDHTKRHLHVRLGEVDFLLALIGDGEVSEHQIDLVGGEHVHTGSRVNRRVFRLHTQILGQLFGEVDVIALVLAVLVHVAEWRLVGEDGNLDLAALLDLVEAAGLGVGAGAGARVGGLRFARGACRRTACGHGRRHYQCRACGNQCFE